MKYRLSLAAIFFSFIFVSTANADLSPIADGNQHTYYTHEQPPAEKVVAPAETGQPQLAPVVAAQPTDTLSAPQTTGMERTQPAENGWTVHNPPPANNSQNNSQTSNSENLPTDVTQPNTQPSAPDPQNSSLTLAERVTRLEQQMKNITAMNLPQQIADLRQNVQQMSGQLQVQQHNLKLLNDQIRTFYQDLSQQIQQMKNLNSDSNSNNNSNNNSSSILNQKLANSADMVRLQEANAYNRALKLLQQRNYDKALAAFQNYLSNYPNGRYVPDSHYWLGEINLQRNNYKTAVAQFNTLVQQHPKSDKVPDAKLKLAIILANQGKIAEAKSQLLSIKKQYPDSTAAQLAAIKLQQLAAQGEN